MENALTAIETRILAGDALNWAVHYAHHLASNGHVPINNEDKFTAKSHMDHPASHFDSLATDWGLGMQFIAQERIGTYEKDGQWYGVHSDDISADLLDESGDETHGIIYADDVIAGETMLEAGLRCYVFQVLGNNAELPKYLALENLMQYEQKMQNEQEVRSRHRMYP